MAPYSFSWNFDDGDNSTSIGQNVLHTFYETGLYNITLAAKDSGTGSQNAFANTLVTITSSANQTTNATNIANATGTNIANATGTNIANATGTNIANATGTNIANATGTNIANATGTNIANATGTNIANATGTNIANSNSTRSVISTKFPETNGTVKI